MQKRTKVGGRQDLGGEAALPEATSNARRKATFFLSKETLHDALTVIVASTNVGKPEQKPREASREFFEAAMKVAGRCQDKPTERPRFIWVVSDPLACGKAPGPLPDKPSSITIEGEQRRVILEGGGHKTPTVVHLVE